MAGFWCLFNIMALGVIGLLALFRPQDLARYLMFIFDLLALCASIAGGIVSETISFKQRQPWAADYMTDGWLGHREKCKTPSKVVCSIPGDSDAAVSVYSDYRGRDHPIHLPMGLAQVLASHRLQFPKRYQGQSGQVYSRGDSEAGEKSGAARD